MRAGLVVTAVLLPVAVLVWPITPLPASGDYVPAATVASSDIGTLQITAFGTSLTRRALWRERLSDRLSNCLGRGVTVASMGRAGAASNTGVALVTNGVSAEMDIAIIEYAMNDADLLDGLSRAESRDNHRRMIAVLRRDNPGIAIILMTTNPVRGLQRLKRPGLATRYRDYAALARETGTGLFDGAGRWNVAGTRGAAIPDGVHPDPRAEADLFAAPLTDMVAQMQGTTCEGRNRQP